jgi:hypothetical protein
MSTQACRVRLRANAALEHQGSADETLRQPAEIATSWRSVRRTPAALATGRESIVDGGLA